MNLALDDRRPSRADENWRPSAAITALQQRSQLLQRLRAFFLLHGYWEVETPLLSRDVCIDTSIDPYVVEEVWYLQTSPEFAMKRLLCAGADSIFEITKSFRAGEQGRRHNPEFTIVEWYRKGATIRDQMHFLRSLVQDLTNSLDPARQLCFESLSYDESFQRFAGLSALNSTAAELRDCAIQSGIAIPMTLPVEDRDGWLNLLLAEVVEPRLASMGGVFLYDYPASQSAIARISPTRPTVAERFELYLDGIEICNGYQELTQSDELLNRMEQRNESRIRKGKSPLPPHSRLFEAMHNGQLNDCSGVALGFDRLVMWLLGKSDISDVMSFSWDRA